jgi:hypothetical protein
MSALRLASAAFVLCGLASAQQDLRSQKDEITLPIPISSPRAVQPGTVEPLTPRDKVNRALRNTFSPRALANRAVVAGWNQLWDDPEEWSGDLTGYGQRFGTRMGRLAVRQGVQLSTDIAFGLDPRYDRCDCSTFKSRTAHAWKRVVVGRRDNGREMIGVSTLAGAYVPPLITDRWLPDSENTLRRKWSSGTQFLVLRGATNMLREFWPEISRKLRLSRFRAGD